MNSAAESREDKRDDGSVSARYAVDQQGLRHGRFQALSPTGKAVETATYEHGQLHGQRMRYDDKGRAVAEETWFHGRLIYPKTQLQITRTIAQLEAEGKSAAASMPMKAKTGIALPDPKELAAALAQLKIDRFLCDVPYRDLVMDADYTETCQYASLLLSKIGHLEHTPAKPVGMDEAFYARGYAGTSRSNLSEGMAMSETPNGYMDDSDASNIDRVGHRRWVLNLGMGKVGFGVDGTFSAMYAFDASRPVPRDIAYTCFPPRGFFPLARFAEHMAWHLSPMPGHFQDPTGAKATIWPIDAHLKRAAKPLDLNYNHIDVQRFGEAPAIIFRPVGLVLKAGSSYEVEITGLTPIGADAATVSYVVTFF